jgi:hypothetical protein
MTIVLSSSCCEFESHSGEVYSIQYVTKFVSDLQVSDFLRLLCYILAINLDGEIQIDRQNITEILLNVVLNTHNPNLLHCYCLLWLLLFFFFSSDCHHLKINNLIFNYVASYYGNITYNAHKKVSIFQI